MAIRFLDVTRRFGAQRALDSVSLWVRPGDCYGFIGHNGAGKTTAMRVALGLDGHFEGRVLIDGFDLRAYPREARARLGGLIEVPGFHPHLDGRANLVMLARLQGIGRRAAEREAQRLLEVVGLAHAGRKAERNYSHGMRQRLGIAQALLGEPACVMLDEPTNGLDPQGIAEIRGLLARLTREHGMTVMLSSHQLETLAGLCNRIGVMHQGRLVVEEETQRLLGGADGRYVLGVAQAEQAERVLAGLALVSRRRDAGGLEVELGQRAPGEVVRRLVESGLDVASFAPQAPSLEEIYLRYARGAAEGAPRAHTGAVAPAAAPRAPAERRAPPWATARALRYELTRVWSRGRLAPLVLLPGLLAVARIVSAHADAKARAELVAKGELFSATDTTAFEGVGLALQAGLPLAGLVLAGLASQSLAGELARGTLRNVVLRPLRRAQAAAGKFAAHALIGVGTYVVLAAAALGLAAWAFDFRGVTEILPNGETYDLVPAAELRPLLRRALLAPLLPLVTYSALGFLAGAVTRGAAAALALGLGLVVFLDLGRAVARGLGGEGYLPTAYLPSPLGDTSYLSYYADAAQGISNSSFAYGWGMPWVPLAWLVVSCVVATALLARRTIP